MAQHVVGLPQGVVELHEYSPLWTCAFCEERDFLLSKFPREIVEVSHGGSTSVRGMSAKPIIDVFVALRKLDDYLILKVPLIDLGYGYHGEDGVEGRQFFSKAQEEGRVTHHIQLMAHDSVHWENHLALREFYQAHPEVMADYIALKQRLAETYPSDRAAYSAGKKDFVNEVLRRARAYRASGVGVY